VGDDVFCFTYGDGLSDTDIAATVEFHRSHGKWATITAIQPPGRFGALELDGSSVLEFREKPKGDGGYINGGFFVLSPAVFDLIDGDETNWERETLNLLVEKDQLRAWVHTGFWQPMDTLRDKTLLEELWLAGSAPWKIW
jgi:glucose-1-phosphate cytidylyltransferase